MVQASYREGRYFDCIRDLEARPDVVDAPTPTGAELRRLALSAYLEVRQVDRARAFVERCLAETPDAPNLLLKHASILALDAKYDDAAEQLMALNRRLPERPAILRRLVAVFERHYRFARYFSPEQHNRPTTVEALFKLNDVELYDVARDPLEQNNLALGIGPSTARFSRR